MRVDTAKCTGCKICEMICSLKHNEKINSQRARIRVENYWPDKIITNVCHNCTDAPCLMACPEEALSQSETGVITVNYDLCTLCQQCIGACPFNAIFIDPENQLLICDSCQGSYDCIQWCPNDAIYKGGNHV